jgi:hypothetical protein
MPIVIPVTHRLILLFIPMTNTVSNLIQEPKLEVADEILVSDLVWRNPIIPPALQRSPDSVMKIASSFIDAMPDRQIIHDDTIAIDDKVMIR